MFSLKLTSYTLSTASANPTIIILKSDRESDVFIIPSVILLASSLQQLPRSPFPLAPMTAAQLNEQNTIQQTEGTN